MTFVVRVADPDGVYPSICTPLPPAAARRAVGRLGARLAAHTRGVVESRVRPARTVLCVVILRGGAMLYPGFAAAFDDADFCMLALDRGAGGQEPGQPYCTHVRRADYDVVVYVDCVCATGATIRRARRVIAERCRSGHDVAAVIGSAGPGTEALRRAGISVLGFSLCESLRGGLVTPDLGERDAGDLFTGTGPP